MSYRPKIVLLGMMTKIPVAGVVWQTVHYLIGFQRLGFDPYYVEAHARTPAMLMTDEADDSGALGGGVRGRASCGGSVWPDAGRTRRCTTTSGCTG